MNKRPIFLLTGASGSGKTSVIPELYKVNPEDIVFDLDSLYGPLKDWNIIKNVWIHIANQITLNNRITILCGTFMPQELEKMDLKDRFDFYFIGLHCSDEIREKRLKERNWDDELIKEHKDFNNWIVNNADKAFDPKMPLIDTSDLLPNEVAMRINNYVKTIICEEI
ncbi:AAA family ATPase [Paenibacillus thalictri]|uniref:Nucleoside kinase n=1 Tax=Paenibacillus thalictri TaxID=2527873 RepID=A0A4Q9DNM9_9BACL|nr:AAA family ATPase [Paenibacillus thalictri]TBL74501.1 hypothetical protein EYB31_24540 [Paenibacillus thalictri]